MTQIELLKLNLINFKGIKQMLIEFSHETSISGENATGKTTIFDAFLWMLFGKDSQDRKDFNVKTLGPDGKAVPYIEHEVSGVLMVNDRKLMLRRVLREQWVKPRGQIDQVFKGNETLYYVDNSPCTMGEYNKEIDSICPEALFKLLTNPEFFPTQNWTKQRNILISLVPELSDTEVFANLPRDLNEKARDFVQTVINEKKLLHRMREMISTTKTKLKDDLDKIPARIDEVKRGMPEPENWQELETEHRAKKARLTEIDKIMASASAGLDAANEEINRRIASRNNADRMAKDIANTIKTRYADYKFDHERKSKLHSDTLKQLGETTEQNLRKLKELQADLADLELRRSKKIEEWKNLKAQKLAWSSDTNCPVCGQQLPEDYKRAEQEKANKEFEESKASAIASNERIGKNLKEQIEQVQGRIRAIQLQNDENAKKYNDLNELPEPELISYETYIDSELKKTNYDEIMLEYADCERYIKEHPLFSMVAAAGNEELEQERKQIRQWQELYSKKLERKESIEKGYRRIAELEKEQEDLAQQLADAENNEYGLTTFVNTKTKMIENMINKRFSYVKFKLFNYQINGGIEDTCECTINGVPYSDLNNAAKMNAGIDIINTLSQHNKVIAPIFIDNRESVNEIIETQAQLISLYVTKDKSLIIKS